MLTDIITRSRPRFWLYTAGPYLLGRVGAITYTTSLHAISLSTDAISLGMVGFIYFLIVANIRIYTINDVHDVDTDIYNTKKGTYENTPLTARGYIARLHTTTRVVVNIATTIILIIGWICLPFIARCTLTILLCCFLFISHQYSAPPTRAKRLPFLDGIYNILYIIPGICGWIIGGQLLDTIVWSSILAGWLWCMAMHAYSAIPDIAPDMNAGLRTTAVVLQKNKTLIYCIICYTIATILGYQTIGWRSVGIGALYITMMTVSLYYPSTFQLYRTFPWINATVGFLLFCVTLM